MKIGEMESDFFFERIKRILRDEFKLDDIVTYDEACSIYKITKDQIKYQVSQKRLSALRRDHRACLLKFEIETLIERGILNPVIKSIKK